MAATALHCSISRYKSTPKSQMHLINTDCENEIFMVCGNPLYSQQTSRAIDAVWCLVYLLDAFCRSFGMVIKREGERRKEKMGDSEVISDNSNLFPSVHF